MPSVNRDRRDASRTFVPRAGDERPSSQLRGPAAARRARAKARETQSIGRRRSPPGGPDPTYLTVLALFCFGFLGVLAFLSISLLCRASGRPVADPDATGPRRCVPPFRRTMTGRMWAGDYQRDQVAARPTAQRHSLVDDDAEGRQQRRGWTSSGPEMPADPSRDGKSRRVGRRGTTSRPPVSRRRRPPWPG